MTTLEKYFQAYRIDHILGFFRIWEIAADKVAGISGTFTLRFHDCAVVAHRRPIRRHF